MSDLGETTSLEKESLEAHVDLCAMRYRHLDLRLSTLEVKMDEIQKHIIEGQKSLKTTIITAAASIVTSVLATIVVLIVS